MAGLWTPDGERQAPPTPDEAEMDAPLEGVQHELASTPASGVIPTHAVRLFPLAAIHPNVRPPNLEDGRLAIDAMAALVEGLAGRLGEEEGALQEALGQRRLAFVSLSGGPPEA